MSPARAVSIRSGRHLEMALEQWTAQLGRENVILDPAALRGAETATFGTSVTVPAIVRQWAGWGGCRRMGRCWRRGSRALKAPAPVHCTVGAWGRTSTGCLHKATWAW